MGDVVFADQCGVGRWCHKYAASSLDSFWGLPSFVFLTLAHREQFLRIEQPRRHATPLRVASSLALAVKKRNLRP